jgi:hypothetical protein
MRPPIHRRALWPALERVDAQREKLASELSELEAAERGALQQVIHLQYGAARFVQKLYLKSISA